MKTRSRDVIPIQRTAFSAANCRRSSKDISSTSWLEAKLLIFPDIDVLLNRTVIDDNGLVWVIPVRPPEASLPLLKSVPSLCMPKSSTEKKHLLSSYDEWAWLAHRLQQLPPTPVDNRQSFTIHFLGF